MVLASLKRLYAQVNDEFFTRSQHACARFSNVERVMTMKGVAVEAVEVVAVVD
jgi:hypothetical protein